MSTELADLDISTRLPPQSFAIFDKWAAVGSRVTCRPPVMHTDEDFLCLARNWQVALNSLVRNGWTLGGSVPADQIQHAIEVNSFVSLKRENQNIILTGSDQFFKRFLGATSIAARFNLKDKGDRIALFQAVLYGNGDATWIPPVNQREVDLL